MKILIGAAIVLMLVTSGIHLFSGNELRGIYFMLMAILFQLYNVEEKSND